MNRNRIILLLFIASVAGLLTYYWYPCKKISAGIVIDRIIVYKSKSLMEVYSKEQLILTYVIAIGKKPVGAKQFMGDGKTPEGEYRIADKNPNSGWHKNLGISYPNQQDIANAAKLGKPSGGDIKIHGLKNGAFNIGRFHRWKNWTNGCIAITNEEMDDLYQHTTVGTVVIIKP
ncbi:MAG: L,D-transpeptidase family protein [Chitinophagaceae bacterium]|nr:L,D-transpeptidase family protein [Chitinophagaceae bacterium]